MSENPYTFTPAADPKPSEEATGSEQSLCPKLPDQFGAFEGNIDKVQALRIARKCRPLAAPDPQTGKTPIRISGLFTVIFLLLFAYGLFVIGRPSAILSGRDRVGEMIFWLTTVIIPGSCLTTIIVLFRRYRVRLEDAQPSIWGNRTTELRPEWYSVQQTSENGRSYHVCFSWPLVQINTSSEAWLLNHQGINPVLILRDWLDEEQQAVLDHFLLDLTKWKTSPAARSPSPDVFPPLPDDGIPFQMSMQQEIEFHQRIAPLIRKEFPDMYPALPVNQPWFWKCAGFTVFLSALCHPVWSLMTGNSTVGMVWIIPSLLAWFLLKIRRDVSPDQILQTTGVITETTVWTDRKIIRGCFHLTDIEKFQTVADAAVLSIRHTKVPFVIPESAFADSDAWNAACSRFQTAAENAG